jgi:hypothetical protein
MKYSQAALVVGFALFSACKDSTGVNSIDQLPIDAIAGGITTPQVLQNLATGVIAQDRSVPLQSYFVWADVIARDVLRLDQSESRYTSEFFINAPDGSGFLGGAQWTGQYVTTRAANNVIIGLKNSPATVATAGQKAAATGFFRTLKALEYMRIAELRDSIGIVIQGDNPAVQDPVLCKANALTAISALLDSGYADLQAGTTLPFTLPSGWRTSNGDYSTMANLILFNRGLKGKIENLRGFDRSSSAGARATAFQNAVTALNIALAGMAPTASGLAQGPYYQYNPNPPESFSSPLADAKLHLNDLFVQGYQAGDQRIANVITRAIPATAQGYSASYDYVWFPSTPSNLTHQIPILQNADLLIERAKAEIELNQFAQAAADLSIPRTVLGGLPPYVAFATQAQARQALLYEQRYTLIGTGPQRWVTLRGYDLVKTLPAMNAAPDPYPQAFPIPQVEVNARPSIACT